jgi:hypothetical protein
MPPETLAGPDWECFCCCLFSLLFFLPSPSYPRINSSSLPSYDLRRLTFCQRPRYTFLPQPEVARGYRRPILRPTPPPLYSGPLILSPSPFDPEHFRIRCTWDSPPTNPLPGPFGPLSIAGDLSIISWRGLTCCTTTLWACKGWLQCAWAHILVGTLSSQGVVHSSLFGRLF